MIKIEIYYDGSITHLKVEYPETEIHVNSHVTREIKNIFLEYMSDAFDNAISSIKCFENGCKKLNKKMLDFMINRMMNKFYDLQVVKYPCEIDYSRNALNDVDIKTYKGVQLVNVNGLGTGQAHFITENGEYLLLPWCYIISMIPSKEGDQK